MIYIDVFYPCLPKIILQTIKLLIYFLRWFFKSYSAGQMLAVLWGEAEVQQLNNAPVYGLYNTNCISLHSK